MKLYIKHIFAASAIGLYLSACSDFLDEKGYNTDYGYYKTSEGVEALVASCYQNGRGIFSTSNTPNNVIFQEIGTDMYTIGGDGGTDFVLYTSTMNPSNDTFSAFWTDCYNGIARTNLGLQYLVASTEMDSELKKVRKGGMKFLCACYYSILITHYGDRPLLLEPVDKPTFSFVCSPQKEVLTQVIEGAMDAYNLLPWADVEGKVTNDYGRANKGAAGHLLAKAYIYRYSQKQAGTQNNSNMNEDRGVESTDLDKVIYYASSVCHFGEQSGSGSLHELATDYSDLWRFDPKTGGPTPDDYAGPEILFSIQFSTDHFFNNQNPTAMNDGGNWLYMMFITNAEGVPMTTAKGDGSKTVIQCGEGQTSGVVRDLITGRGWGRISPTPFLYEDNGLYGPQYYASNKHGKLIDSRLYKSHVWVYYCNTEPTNNNWCSFSNAAGNFDPSDIGMATGEPRYGIGDPAIVFFMENTDDRLENGTMSEKLALARAQEPYWCISMQSINHPGLDERGDRGGIRNTFPGLLKYLDTRYASANGQAGYRNYFCFRSAETYVILAEAYALKGNFVNSAVALNIVRERAAWKESEEKPFHYYKYNGGSREDLTKSTVEDMKVSSNFLSRISEDEILIFFLDEYGHEMEGELYRFE